jgi:hypothetical protein
VIKGAVVRGFLEALAQDGTHKAVLARVPPERRSLLDPPPLSSEWLDETLFEELLVAIAGELGEQAIQPLSRRASARWSNLVQPVVSGLLRLFGGSPATLFSRMDMLSRTARKGSQMQYQYVARSPRAGTLEVKNLGRPETRHYSSLAIMGGLQAIFDLCGEPDGSIAMGKVSESDGHVTVEFRLRW